MSEAEKSGAKFEPARASGWDMLSEEKIKKNETNIDSATGKERKISSNNTFSDMDLYARSSYKSTAAQFEHRKNRNDWTVWADFVPKEVDETKTSSENNKAYSDLIISMQKQHPREEGESLDEYRERVKNIVNPHEEESKAAETEGSEIEAELNLFKERLERQAKRYEESGGKVGMSPEHVSRLIENRLGKFILAKQSAKPEAVADTPASEDKKEPESATEKAENVVETAVTEETEEKADKFDPEVQKFLDDRLAEINWDAEKYKRNPFKNEYKKYNPERIAHFKEEALALAREKQAAIDKERQEALERERQEALERERQEALEKERQAAAEAEKREALEREALEKSAIVEAVSNLTKEQLEQERTAAEKERAEKEKRIAELRSRDREITREIEEVEKEKFSLREALNKFRRGQRRPGLLNWLTRGNRQ